MSQTKIAVGMVDASGTPGSGNFLRGDGAWQAAGGDGWAFVSSQSASSSASITFTGFVTGFDYLVCAWNVILGTDGQFYGARMGISSGPTIRTSGYLGIGSGVSETPAVTQDHDSTIIDMTGSSGGTSTDEKAHHQSVFFEPAASGHKTAVLGTWFMHNSAGLLSAGALGGNYNTAEAHDRVQFISKSGNIASGEYYLYKRANA